MKKFILEHFGKLIILLIISVMCIEKCSKEKIEYINKTSTKRDTVWVNNTNTITTIPQIVETIRDTIQTKTIEYLPSENYAELKAQFLQLKEELLSKNIYKDNFKVDSLGSISIVDTISKNRILGRSFKYDFKYPLITNTITQTKVLKPKNQVYIGLGINGNEDKVFDNIMGGIFLKNKRDRIFGLNATMDFKGNINYGIQSLWKISLKKNN